MTVTFPSLIAISDGIHPVPVFIMDMCYICWLLLDSAHDAMPVYKYCKRKGITPFIDLNEKRVIKVKYKNDFTIGKDGVPVCKEGRQMNHDGSEPAKNRI